jgi:hypothetical protein
MKKYDLHVSLQPQLYNGAMAHYWHITLQTDDGTFTIQDGWASEYGYAIQNAERYMGKTGLVK